MSLVLGVLAAVLLALALRRWAAGPGARLPPGPRPWPLAGNLGALRRADPYAVFAGWRRTYGPVFTCWLGNVPAVVLADFPTIQHCLVRHGDAFASRFAYGRMTELVRGGYDNVGILDEGRKEVYTEHRRFYQRFVRNLIAHGDKLEDQVLAQVHDFIEELSEHERADTAVDFVAVVDRNIASVISQMLFGNRYNRQNREEFDRFKHLIDHFLLLIADPIAMSVAHSRINWTRVPPFSGRYERIRQAKDALFAYIEEKVSDRELALQDGAVAEPPTNFVDAYLIEMGKDDAPAMYNRTMLCNLAFDFFSGGQETTSNTIAFTLIYILGRADVQTRLHAELGRVVGARRPVTVDQRGQLPYLAAVIAEGQRLANLVVLNFLRHTTEPVAVNGFELPAGTCVMPQICCVLYDENIFPEPLEFKPERFLNRDGTFRRYEEFIPFSLGKRQCLGENLARLELFLFMANLFNEFEISPADPSKPPSAEKMIGMTAQARPFQIRLTRRH